MSNRKVPRWVFKQQRAKAKEAAKGQNLAFNCRRPRRNRVYTDRGFEARSLRKNDPLQMMKRRVPKTRRPAPPLVTQQAPEYMKPWQSPYAPLNGRMPEYLNPNTPVPQNPMFRRTPEMDHY